MVKKKVKPKNDLKFVYFPYSKTQLQQNEIVNMKNCALLRISKIFNLVVPFLFHFLFAVHRHILLEGLSFLLLLLFLFVFFLLLLAHHLLESFGVVVVDIFVHSSLQPFHQLFLYFLFDVGCNQSFGFPNSISLLSFLFYGDKFLLTLKLELSHLNDHLPELGESLLALVDDEGRPINELFVDLLQCFMVIFVKLYFLPQIVGQMGALSSFHKQVADPFFLPDGGVLRIGKWTGSAIAKAGEVILVFAEILGVSFHPVGTVLVADHIPHNLIYNHLQHSKFIIYEYTYLYFQDLFQYQNSIHYQSGLPPNLRIYLFI